VVLVVVYLLVLVLDWLLFVQACYPSDKTR
jgi:hypothetical protein